MSGSIGSSTGPFRLGALNAATNPLPVRAEQNMVVEFVNDASFVGTVAIERRDPRGANVWAVTTIDGQPAVFINSTVVEVFQPAIGGVEYRLRVTAYTSGSGVGAISQ
jgi:hypothetical protein